MAAMRSACRPLLLVLAALLVWGAGAPLVAVTCVPFARCAGAMKHCALANAPRTGLPAVGAPDCCEQKARESGPAAIPGAKLDVLAADDVPAAVSEIPSPPGRLWHRLAAESPAASPVPLYTLHSILLI
jgi:hypothetical protein